MSPFQELETAKYFAASQSAAAEQQKNSKLPVLSILKLSAVATCLFAGALFFYQSDKIQNGLTRVDIQQFRRNPLNVLIWFAGDDYMEDAENRADWRQYELQRELEDQLLSPEEHEQQRWDQQHRPRSVQP